jgi:hypothetical protein
MLTTDEAILVHDFEQCYDRWAGVEPLRGEPEDVTELHRWFEWLWLDLAAKKLARYLLKKQGEIEGEGRLVKLNADGLPVLYYDDQAMPVVAPRRYTSPPAPRRRREVTRAA